MPGSRRHAIHDASQAEHALDPMIRLPTGCQAPDAVLQFHMQQHMSVGLAIPRLIDVTYRVSLFAFLQGMAFISRIG
eukprot:1157661-Pelagomonas_calceolata.AAC.3